MLYEVITSRILKRLGLNRLAALDPAEPVRRYQRDHPGELIHIDIKKLGRFERRITSYNVCYTKLLRPAGLIEQHECVSPGRDLGCDFIEMQLHHGGVAAGKHEPCADAARRADRTRNNFV